MMDAVGSARAWRVGVVQLAVFVFVDWVTSTVYVVNLSVRRALVAVVVTRFGVIKTVGVTVVDGWVMVDGTRTKVEVSVTVDVAATGR
jgi:hypothetical protein